MSNLSEEEIIKKIKQLIEEYEEVIQEEQERGNVEGVECGIETKDSVKGLLDLYTKEKLKKSTYEIQIETIEIEKLKRDFYWRYKIEDKIKELEEEQEEYKDSQEWEIQDSIQTQISLLKSLLEGE